jgi:glutamate-1-semialdehyde 2,1-aminomutase
MIDLATRFTSDARAVIERYGMDWSVTQLGTRCEYRFAAPAPRSGGESAASADAELENFLHLFAINRGVLLTPFHNMALMCPRTTLEHVERHGEVFDAAVKALTNP